MSVALPSILNYGETHSALPDGMTAYTISLQPVNGSVFAPGSVIILDFNNRGLIIPDSIYIRYKYSITAAAGSQFIGTPAYSSFVRLETLFGSVVSESINQYNQTANMLVNLTQDTSSKYGLQNAYGYNDNTTTPSLAQLDGRTNALNETGTFSAMLPGLLSNAEKAWPAFAMPQVRVQLTMDSIANIFTTAVVPTAYTISNFELVYQMLDVPADVENMIRSVGDRFYIKSQSFMNSSVTLATGTTGSISLVYNSRLASVKSAFLNFSGTSANSINKWGDSYDVTSSNGDYQLQVGGVVYPQRSLSTLNNKTGILQELRRAVGSIYDKTNSLSINSVEFNRVGNDATSNSEPGKFWVGINLEKLHSHSLLTGISTANSAITLQINTSTATAQTHTCNLILNYDALVEIDQANRMVSVKQ